MKNLIKVYYWNSNGTNDIEIVESSDKHGPILDVLTEALFGLDICKFEVHMDTDTAEYAFVPLKTVLKYIAVSPVLDGTYTINFLKKYFKSVK